MARKRSKNKNKKIKMSSERLLDNSEEEETDFKKIIKLEQINFGKIQKVILMTMKYKNCH